MRPPRVRTSLVGLLRERQSLIRPPRARPVIDKAAEVADKAVEGEAG